MDKKSIASESLKTILTPLTHMIGKNKRTINEHSQTINEHSQAIDEHSQAIDDIDERAVQPNWDQNDSSAPDYVKNRTHYITVKQLTFDGNLDGRETVSAEGMIYVKLSNKCLNYDDLVGAHVHIFGWSAFTNTIGISTTDAPDDFTITSDMIMQVDGVVLVVANSNEPLSFIVSGNMATMGVNGTYVLYVPEGTDLNGLVFSEDIYIDLLEFTTIKQLDSKYLDDGVVKYSAQSLDDDQKKTARSNIGLPETTATNQQLVTDVDGNVVWEEKLGYKDRVYVEQVDVSVGIYSQGYGSLPFEFFPVDGETYTITWDGTSYDCLATTITIDSEDVIVVGNTTLFGGTANSYIPAAICSRSGRATVYATESGDHTIGVTGYVKNPKKIARDYIDWNPVVGVIDSYYYNYRYLNEARGASIAEIRKAATDKNKDIIIRLDLDNWQGTMRYLGLVNVSTDGSTYKSALLFSTIKSENASINISEQTIAGNMMLEYWYTFLEPAEGIEANAFISCQFGKVDLTDVATKSDIPSIPTVTADDAGKFLRVSADGAWIAEAIASAKEASF